jgi:hypothetical protein
MKKFLLSLIFSGFLFTQAIATTFVGAEISYKHITGNTYEIKVTSVVEYVGGNPIFLSNLRVNYSNSCSFGTLQLPIDTTYASNISCSLIFPHIINEYKTQFTFPTNNCNGIVLTLNGPCCMIQYDNMQSGSVSMDQVKAEILFFSSQNTSANFNTSVIRFAQKNSTTDIDLSASDINVDSLIYTLADASGTYPSGYTLSDPFGPNGSSTLNPTTGVLTVNPTALGTFLINVLVSEYKNGILVGKTQREWAIKVIDNVATNHNPSLSGINITNNYSITACLGDTIDFFANITDLDTNQVVRARLLQTLPFAKLTITGRTVNFKWILDSPNTAGSYHPTIQLDDQNCGVTNFTYNITVNPCIPTSIIENKQSSFSIYPNPSQGVFTLNLNEENINSTVSVRSITGQLLQEIQVLNSQQQFNISELESGIYFISIPTKSGMVSKKIILAK